MKMLVIINVNNVMKLRELTLVNYVLTILLVHNAPQDINYQSISVSQLVLLICMLVFIPITFADFAILLVLIAKDRQQPVTLVEIITALFPIMKLILQMLLNVAINVQILIVQFANKYPHINASIAKIICHLLHSYWNRLVKLVTVQTEDI